MARRTIAASGSSSTRAADAGDDDVSVVIEARNMADVDDSERAETDDASCDGAGAAFRPSKPLPVPVISEYDARSTAAGGVVVVAAVIDADTALDDGDVRSVGAMPRSSLS